MSIIEDQLLQAELRIEELQHALENRRFQISILAISNTLLVLALIILIIWK